MDDSLSAAIRSMEQGLNLAQTGALRPEKQLLAQLETVGMNLNQHIELDESRDGIYSMIDAQNPRLLSRAQKLRDDHGELTRQLDVLKAKLIFSAETGYPDIGQVYQDANCLLSGLRQHQERSAALVFEAFLFDGGAGD